MSALGHGFDDHDAHPPAKPWVRLRQLLQYEHRDLLAVLIYATVIAILSLASPIAVESLVSTVAFGVLLWPIIVISLTLLACLGLAAAIQAMQVYVVECLQRRLFVRVTMDYANRLPHICIFGLDGRHGPELANRFFDVLNVQKSLASLILDGLAVIVTAVTGMIVLAFYHPFLLGFDIVLLASILFLLFVLGRNGVTSSLAESHAKYDVAGWLQELMRCPRAFKFAHGSKLAIEKADRLTYAYVTARENHFRIVWRQTLTALGIQVIASTALLGLGGWLVITRQLTLGQLVASELIVSLIVHSTSKLGKYAETFYDLMSGSEKLGIITDLPLERLGGERPPERAIGMAVRMRATSHAPFRSRHITYNWSIAPNERIAIVGRPGAGKTRLFEIICGLRPPDAGTIEIDGVDLRSLDPELYRDRVALVGGQEIFLGTVMENVRVGRSHLTPGEIREALRVVGLIDVVHSLPKGLDTPLTPTGGPLSATECLRLLIARAIVGAPRLLIIDGVLDSLDLRECPELMPVLFDRKAPWTLLVATVDPEIIKQCDRVIEVGDSGDHEIDSHATGGATS